MPFDVQRRAPQIAIPTLIVHSERALAPALARAFFAALTPDKEELWVNSKGQIDFYDDPELMGLAAERIASFFGGHAKRRASRPTVLARSNAAMTASTLMLTTERGRLAMQGVRDVEQEFPLSISRALAST